MAEFGYHVQGPSNTPAVTDRLYAQGFTAPAAGTLTTISVYLSANLASNQSYRAFLYAGSVGAPGARIASTPEATYAWGSEPAGWKDFGFSSPPAITAGTYYFIGWHAAVTNQASLVYYDGGHAGDFVQGDTAYGASDPNPFGTPTSSANLTLSVYATYTPTGGGSSANLLLLGVG